MALPPRETVERHGRRIAWRGAGEGPPVLLLHGIGSGSASWEAQLDALAGRYRAVAWDAPGYGGSDPLPGDTPPSGAYGDAVADLLDGLGIERVNLVGHSLGGLIAASFAARHPERLASLTLSDATAGYLNSPEELRVGRMNARIEAMTTLGPAEVAKRRAREVLAPGAPDAIYQKVRAVQSRVRPEGYAQAARMLHGSDIFADAAAIRAPVLVMYGGEDKVTPEAIGRDIAAAIPGARYLTLEGLGHASYVEGPAAFNAALTGFLDGAGTSGDCPPSPSGAAAG